MVSGHFAENVILGEVIHNAGQFSVKYTITTVIHYFAPENMNFLYNIKILYYIIYTGKFNDNQ